MSDLTDQGLSKPLILNDLVVPEALDNENDNYSIYRFLTQKKMESAELAKAYDLLGFCCSLDVCMESLKEPYKLPCYLLDSTSISEKLGSENLNLLEKIEESGIIKSNIVASRISDLLYLFGADQSHSRLTKTINHYKKMIISSENWYNFSEHQLKRAIDLSKKIQKKEADHLVFFKKKSRV